MSRGTLFLSCMTSWRAQGPLYFPLITRPQHCLPGTELPGPAANFSRLVSKSKKRALRTSPPLCRKSRSA
jgi:hypothetical protein